MKQIPIYLILLLCSLQSFSQNFVCAVGVNTQTPYSTSIPYQTDLILPYVPIDPMLPKTDIVISDPQDLVLVDAANQIYEPKVIGSVPRTTTSIDPTDYNFGVGDEICITVVSYDINAAKEMINSLNPIESSSTCCLVLESILGTPICTNMCLGAGICYDSDVIDFTQLLAFFESFNGGPVSINQMFNILASLNESPNTGDGALLDLLCPGLLEALPVCAGARKTTCYTLEPPCATPAVIPPPSIIDFLVGTSIPVPLYLPATNNLQTDLFIVDPQDLVLVDSATMVYEPKLIDIIPSTATTVNPVGYNFEGGEQFCITSISYDITAVQAFIDILNPLDSLGICCTTISTITNEPICNYLANKAIYSGSDIVDFSQVYAILETFNQLPTVGSVYTFLSRIDQILADNTDIENTSCSQILQTLPICMTSSNTICYSLNSSNCNFTEYITGTIPENTYQASNSITADGTTNPSDTTTFQAGNYIDLQQNFNVPLGCQFTAEIIPCSQ